MEALDKLCSSTLSSLTYFTYTIYISKDRLYLLHRQSTVGFLTNLKIFQGILFFVAQRCSVNKVFLEISQSSQENAYVRVSFLIKLKASASNSTKKETLTQVFSCEFCEISKNIFLTEHLWWLLLMQVDIKNDPSHGLVK